MARDASAFLVGGSCLRRLMGQPQAAKGSAVVLLSDHVLGDHLRSRGRRTEQGNSVVVSHDCANPDVGETKATKATKATTAAEAAAAAAQRQAARQQLDV